MTTTKTPGQQLAATLRRYLSVGTRTRRLVGHRGTLTDLHGEMISAIFNAAWYPGYYTQATEDALHAGFGAAVSYEKHVKGYRIDGALASKINDMSPWQFASLLGRMADAGVTCTGDGERFFAQMSREVRAAS